MRKIHLVSKWVIVFAIAVAACPDHLSATSIAATIRVQICSVETLRMDGFLVGIVKNAGPLTSYTIDVEAIPKHMSFRWTYFFVLNEDITSPERLKNLDSTADERAIRQQTIGDRKASFTVFGKEYERSYIRIIVTPTSGSPDLIYYLIRTVDIPEAKQSFEKRDPSPSAPKTSPK